VSSTDNSDPISRAGLNVDEISHAVDKCFAGEIKEISEMLLGTLNSMPGDASDFDRGMAAGMALERWQRLAGKS
jgi:hypothetical protein